MELEKITEELNDLIDRLRGYVTVDGEEIPGIIDWIKSHPGTDPNAYEIMDCNVKFAEIIAKYKKYYIEEGKLNPHNLGATSALSYMMPHHPELEECYICLEEMDMLRDTANHPFFTSEEAYTMYTMVKACQDFASYTLPEDKLMQDIKRETLCKSMSVPFYIWQVHREKSDYQYDNKQEFEGMKERFALYESSETPCQFAKAVSSLHEKIEKDYKYAPLTETPKLAVKR